MKLLLYSDKFFTFRRNFVFKETFYIQRKFLCPEKIFIFRENVDIHRKYAYSEKTTNLNFKLFEMQLQDFGRYTWYKERKLKQWLKGNWPDSTMLASNEGPSRRSTLIFLEKLSRLAEELQNIIPEDRITYKERIREALQGLQYLKVTKCESRQHLEDLLNVFYQDLSR